MGIQDAYNLAWKLALVQKGIAKDMLLDSYEAERRPIADATLRGTDAATRGLVTALSIKNPIALSIRNHFMSFVTSLGFVKERAGRNVSQIEVGYPKSPVVGQDQPPIWSVRVVGSDERPGLSDWIHFGDGPAPGMRAPDVPFSEKSLFDILRGTHHTLLCFDGVSATPEGYERLMRVIAVGKAKLGERLKGYVVVPNTTRPEALSAETAVLLDAEGELHRRFGARSECVYLIRPDGYVAYRCQPGDEFRLGAFLDRLFV